jgi:hypothetical protein
VQGEQVALLWGQMMNQYGINIHFAHRTFKWSNEAKGNAAVYCVIIGFAHVDSANKTIFEYENIKGEAHAIAAKHINAYLTDAPNVFIESRKKPLIHSQSICYGSFALDDGNYTLTETEKDEILLENPSSSHLVKIFLGGRELLHNEKRYCLWLKDASPIDLKANGKILERIEAVQKWRNQSNRATTKKLANTPTLFAEVRQPETNFLAFPTVSSENRNYIPTSFLTKDTVASNQLYVLPNATLYHFGILTSLMHMAWVKTICGRLKSDYRYSASIVYNNYPWPENPADKHRANIETAAQAVLDARAAHPTCSLADLYDPLTMPVNLVQAHAKLDKAVDAAYTFKGTSDVERVAFLFALYQTYTNQLIQDAPIKPKRRAKTTA